MISIPRLSETPKSDVNYFFDTAHKLMGKCKAFAVPTLENFWPGGRPDLLIYPSRKKIFFPIARQSVSIEHLV